MYKVAKCNCKHAWQDRRYGKGKRVHNKMGTGTFRCTVCGNTRT